MIIAYFFELCLDLEWLLKREFWYTELVDSFSSMRFAGVRLAGVRFAGLKLAGLKLGGLKLGAVKLGGSWVEKDSRLSGAMESLWDFWLSICCE